MTATLTVRLSDDEHRKLRAYARRRGWSLNEALRRMIDESTAGRAADGLTPGLFDSGDATLARRVDEELANGFGE
ncbi:MAG: ribbon-helix-helix protein, CopG family [Micromonosporaceae bacterium]|nr:ribbon-helix-helix protein, CopG family [Micromonosporaceae bacterium]